MARTLSIYACSGIGSNAPAERTIYDYWTDNTNAVTNTQAVNSLLLRINTDAIEILNLPLTDEEVLERLNEIDWYAATLYFLKQYESKVDQMVQLRRAIGKAWDNGLFEYVEFDNKKRDLHLDEVIGKIAQYMDDANIKEPSSTFRKWWSQEISNKNKNIFTPDQRRKLLDKKATGIGANYDEKPELAAYLNKGAEYFLYLYASDEQLKQLPEVFAMKRAYQLRTYLCIKDMYVGIYGDEKSLQEAIYGGIVNTIHDTPQKAISDIVVAYKNRDAKVSGIGALSAAVIASIQAVVALINVILTVLSIVASVIKYIVDANKEIELARSAAPVPDPEDIDESIPDKKDYDKFNLNNWMKKNKSTLWIAGAILAIALLIKRK